MKIHEYQAKGIFKKSGIPVPDGQVVTTPDEAVKACQAVNGPPWVVKAQVHAGGRGKGGGVKVVADKREVVSAAEAMLGTALVTPQTGPEGVTVHQLLIEEGMDIDREFYLGMVIDRAKGMPAMIFSPAGGMSIEEVAARTPELIWTEYVDPASGWMPYQARNLVYRLDPLPFTETLRGLMNVMAKLCKVFTTSDCSLVEINPLDIVAVRPGIPGKEIAGGLRVIAVSQLQTPVGCPAFIRSLIELRHRIQTGNPTGGLVQIIGAHVVKVFRRHGVNTDREVANRLARACRRQRRASGPAIIILGRDRKR